MTPPRAAPKLGFKAAPAGWSGFGTEPQSRINWPPDILCQSLNETLGRLKPTVVVAAGHAAYAARELSSRDTDVECLVSVAPTWRDRRQLASGTDLTITIRLCYRTQKM